MICSSMLSIKWKGLYNHWFLGELGNNWSDVCADELATYGKVLEVPPTGGFFIVPVSKPRIRKYL